MLLAVVVRMAVQERNETVGLLPGLPPDIADSHDPSSVLRNEVSEPVSLPNIALRLLRRLLPTTAARPGHTRLFHHLSEFLRVTHPPVPEEIAHSMRHGFHPLGFTHSFFS